MAPRSLRAGCGVATLALLGGAVPGGPAAAFTAEQAADGKVLYEAQCGLCHGRNLEGGEAPQLIGVDTMQNFSAAGGLYEFISVAMPPSAPGQLGSDAYLAIVAHIMQVNGGQPDGAPLPADEAALEAITIANLGNVPVAPTPAPGAGVAAAPVPAPAVAAAPAPAASDVPQAFTWGRQLPGGPAAVAAAAPAPTGVPQAFTWGAPLPGATPPVVAVAAEAVPAGVPQAFTWGAPLPTVTAAAEPTRPGVPQAFTWGTPLPAAN